MAQKHPTLTMDEMIGAGGQDARDHYEHDGWDYVVEAWSDEDIIKELGRTRTAPNAIHRIWKAVRLVDSVRRDIQNA